MLLAALMLVWGDALRRDLRRLVASPPWRVVVAADTDLPLRCALPFASYTAVALALAGGCFHSRCATVSFELCVGCEQWR